MKVLEIQALVQLRSMEERKKKGKIKYYHMINATINTEFCIQKAAPSEISSFFTVKREFSRLLYQRHRSLHPYVKIAEPYPDNSQCQALEILLALHITGTA